MPVLLPQSEYRRMQWANGGGETWEVARFPQGQAVSGFDWRISIATISESGPFSSLAGIDRLFLPLQGAGVWLTIGDGEPKLMETGDAAIAFRGEEACDCRLVDGMVRDLNVMTRRGICTAKLVRHHDAGPLPLPAGAEVILLLALDTTGIQIGQTDHELGPLDSLMIDNPQRDAPLLRSDGKLIAISIFREDEEVAR